MPYEVTRLLRSDGTWDSFEADWRKQCDDHKEDFTDYAAGTFAVIEEIVATEQPKAGVFAIVMDGQHESICQVNTAMLPGYDSPVLRVRHLTMCPDLDFGEHSIEDYVLALTRAFAGIVLIAEEHVELGARHIKFHLRSPNDRHFFSILGAGLNETDEFESVRTVGSWLYVTRS